MIQIRNLGLAALLWSCTSCALWPEPDAVDANGNWPGHRSSGVGGLAVGFVVNSGGGAALKAHQRQRYSDKLASAILEENPEMSGNLDSYAYVSARVGKPFAGLVNSYRLEGTLSPRAIDQLHAAQLRRRYLLLATIAPIDQIVELPAEVRPRSGPANLDVEDYQDVRLHTVRLKAVKIEVYDLLARRKMMEKILSSDDQNSMLATQSGGQRYVGNSLLAAIANSVGNRIRHGGDLKYPGAPDQQRTLDHLWRQVARSLPAIR